MEENETKKVETAKEENAEIECKDRRCPFHGRLSARGRSFKGIVKKIVGKRAVIEFKRLVRHKKYERYAKAKTRLHAHIPECLAQKVNIGSIVKVTECRPLSKIIHFVVVDVVGKEKGIEEKRTRGGKTK